MNANVLYGLGDLQYVSIPTPSIKENEVLVKIKAAGLCGSDIERVYKTGTYHFPTIIGHEFAGEIVQAHENRLLGKRVTVFPLIPCNKCSNCIEGKYELCNNYNYLGSRCDGGFAEYAAVPKWNIMELPDNVSFLSAAMCEPASVALHALKRSNFRFGDTIAIIGPGTIGLILSQLAILAGAKKVILVGRNQNKLNFAKHIGIHETCNSTSENVTEFVNSLTNNYGVDVAIEGTGVSTSLNMCLDIVKSSGNILVLGNPKEDISINKVSYWKILRKQLSINGTWNSSYGIYKNDWKTIISLLSNNKLDLENLITHTFPLSKLIDGLNVMQDNKMFSNKIMVINE